MKVALFGGRFDPVHNGHIGVAQEVLRVKKADAVWFVPDNQHQWNPIAVSAADRISMLRLAIDGVRYSGVIPQGGIPQNDDFFEVSDIAIRLGGMTKTIDVFQELQKQFPHDHFFFLCGSDQVARFHEWTGWEILEKELSFLIIPRKNYSVTNLPKNCTLFSDATYIPLDDASTTIRERIKTGKSIHNLVPEAVEKYIIEKRLYK